MLGFGISRRLGSRNPNTFSLHGGDARMVEISSADSSCSNLEFKKN